MKFDVLSRKIVNDEIYGLVQVDISVPESLRDYFSELLPIFKNTAVGRHHLRGHMAVFAEHNGIMKNGWRCFDV